MAALKVLVVGMGVLIAAGLATVAVTIANRMAAPAPQAGPADAAALGIPPGAAVLETDLDGGRIALRLRLPDGRTEIHVFDLAGGRRLGRYAVAAP